MGVPMTTGILRTKVADMEIGDFIICKYVATSGAVGTFSELGTSVTTEIPLVGAVAPNGTFYFVKSDKGLLISDRVVQHTISWDVLNAGKVIQGITWGNLVPTMTSNISPSGVASASNVYSDSGGKYEAWRSFDNSALNWICSGTTGWIEYDFQSSKIVKKYFMKGSSGSQNQMPKSWEFQGWDGNQWIVLDTKSEITWNPLGEKKEFSILNDIGYTKYRVKIFSNGSGSLSTVGKLEMYEIPTLIRSLTGGVAYADANGNSTTTVGGFGSFPTNNEWDKYIVNFPTNKIQSGKTLDDVFHHLKGFTWAQDTPSTLPNSSSPAWRVLRIRGDRNANPTATNPSAIIGFRPVFEYQE